MPEEEQAHPQALAGLGIWAAQTLALLISELRANGAVDQSFVDQVATRLGQYDADAPPGAEHAYQEVRRFLSDQWRQGDG